MVDQEVTIVAEPDEILQYIIFPIFVHMMYREYTAIIRFAQATDFRDFVPI